MAAMGVGIIGMGWVAGAHLSAWNRNPHTRVVAVASRTRAGAEQRLAECGATARVYDHWQQVIEDPEVQIVSVCSPPDHHVEQAVAAAQAGKHICLEKPIALNQEDLNRLRAAVQKAGVRSVVCFVLRWNPMFQTIKALMADGALGPLFYAETNYFNGGGQAFAQYHWNITRRAGGSSLLSAGCHAVDALRWFVGSEAVEVRAFSSRGAGPGSEAYEYDPTEMLIVRFQNGVIGKVASSLECVMPYAFDVTLLGAQGSIRNNAVWSPGKYPGQTDWVRIPTILPDSADVHHHPFQGQMDHFVECIRSGVESHCNIEDAVHTHELCLAADRSAAAGGEPVRLKGDV
ncbi:MAG: Gfo/Idh/MocA family protein [Anaerolineae bacterium]